MSVFPMFPRKMIFSVLGILLLWLTIPFTASAHTSLESAIPAKDATVQEAVNEIGMNFNTSIAELSSFTVTSANGQAVTVNDIKVNGSSMSGKPAQPLTSGTYKVQWKIVGEDSHPIEGSYSFSVAAATSEPVNKATGSAETTSEAAGSTDASSTSTSSTDATSETTNGSAASGDTAVENPTPTTSAETNTTPADDATTDQKPASSEATPMTGDEKDDQHVSPATWIITIAVILIAIIAAVTTIGKRRKN